MHAGEKYFDDYELGEIVPAASRTVTEADVVNFAGLSGDYHPLHINDLFAQKSQFGRRIAHGMLTLTIMSGLMHTAGIAGDKSMAFLSLRNWDFKAPIYLGDTMTVRIEVADKHESKKPDRGVITFHCQILNLSRDGEVSSEGDWVQMYARRGPAAPSS